MARRRKLPRQRQPRAIERAYARDLLALVKKLRAAGDRAIAKLKEIDRRNRSDSWRTDKVPDRNVEEVTTVLRGLRTQFDTIVKKARPGLIAQGVGERTSAFAMKAADDVVRGAVTIPSEKLADKKLLKTFQRENVKLVESIPKKLHAQLTDVIGEGWGKGRRVEDIAADIGERFDVTESRAKLIARTEVSKLSAQVTRARHEQIGITKFVWISSRDERVRELHQEYDGNVYRYDSPPEDGLPGTPPNCRCIGEPVIPDLEDE